MSAKIERRHRETAILARFGSATTAEQVWIETGENTGIGSCGFELVAQLIADAEQRGRETAAPIPLRIVCPECGELHIDEGEFATKPHHTHSCQACGLTWRPAVVATVGVRFLPGFKNKE